MLPKPRVGSRSRGTNECRPKGWSRGGARVGPPAPHNQDGTDYQNQTTGKYVHESAQHPTAALVVQHYQFAVEPRPVGATLCKTLTVVGAGVEVMDFRPNVTIAYVTATAANSFLMTWVEHGYQHLIRRDFKPSLMFVFSPARRAFQLSILPVGVSCADGGSFKIIQDNSVEGAVDDRRITCEPRDVSDSGD